VAASAAEVRAGQWLSAIFQLFFFLSSLSETLSFIFLLLLLLVR